MIFNYDSPLGSMSPPLPDYGRSPVQGTPVDHDHLTPVNTEISKFHKCRSNM